MRSFKSEAEIHEQHITKHQSELKELEWVEEADKRLKELECLESDIEQAKSEICELDRLVSLVKSLVAKRRVIPDYTELECRAEKLKVNSKKLQELEGLIRSARALIDNRVEVPSYSHLEKGLRELQKSRSDIEELSGLVEAARTATVKLQSARKKIVKCETVLAEESGGLCPVCGKPMESDDG